MLNKSQVNKVNKTIKLRNAGLTYKEIAEKLNISRQRVGQILDKTHLKNKTRTIKCKLCKKKVKTKHHDQKFCSEKCSVYYRRHNLCECGKEKFKYSNKCVECIQNENATRFEESVKLKKEGKTYVEIAKIQGVCKGTIARDFRKKNNKKPKNLCKTCGYKINIKDMRLKYCEKCTKIRDLTVDDVMTVLSSL